MVIDVISECLKVTVGNFQKISFASFSR